ncbi:NADH-quinone oxidoreductase subunit A [Gordonia sp. MP11Mi]|uniref:NADH-quinone oxidoreductase subunit A n=1 Tax=Gordonia sp. MP11Mi TaxID=3022769 RepID=A0AA97GUR2_9ACTN
MNAYGPILVLAAIAAAFAIVSVMIASVVGPRRRNAAKLAAYECGIEPLPPAADIVQRFPVKYYLTAMLFIIFDIEIVFLYPWAVASESLGWFGLIAVALFVVNVSVAYAYEWRRGGLRWD